MSVYHSSFNYLGINSRLKNLIVAHFDADQGEQDTYLGLEPVYTDSAYGMMRHDYGARWNSVATFRISTVKSDMTEFSVAEVRGCLAWLTGTTSNSKLELLVGEKIKASFIGRVTNVWTQKQDAKIFGLVIEFTSASPFAYSPTQKITRSIAGNDSIQIKCSSDDWSSYVYLQTTYKNKSGNSLTIKNMSIEGETTTVTGLAENETITIDSNMMIASDKDNKTFGTDFNFVFPRLKPGINDLSITANGDLTLEYIYPIKIADAIDIEELNNSVDCNSNPGTGNVVVEHTAWENIWNKPTTIKGYGITDACSKNDVYTKDQVYTKAETYSKGEVYNKSETYNKTEINNTVNDIMSSDVDWKRIANKPTTLQGYGITNAYTTEQVYNKSETYAKGEVYNKTEINTKITSVYKYMGSVANESLLPTSNLAVGYVYNLEDSGMNVAWNGTAWDTLGSIVDLTPYITEAEVEALLSSVRITIDEDQLNAMLTEVLI